MRRFFTAFCDRARDLYLRLFNSEPLAAYYSAMWELHQCRGYEPTFRIVIGWTRSGHAYRVPPRNYTRDEQVLPHGVLHVREENNPYAKLPENWVEFTLLPDGEIARKEFEYYYSPSRQLRIREVAQTGA